jgi:hypothetical protein
VFHVDVAKVDRDVAHVAMAIHVCFKYMFLMFHLFQTCGSSVSSRCCKSRFRCCMYMQVFQVFSYVYFKYFHLDVPMFCNGYTHAFKFFLCFASVSNLMLQVFQLFRTYIASVLSGCCRSRSDVAHVEWEYGTYLPQPPTAVAGALPSGRETSGQRWPHLGAPNEQTRETRCRETGQ